MDQENLKLISPAVLGTLYWLLNQFFSSKEKRIDSLEKKVEKIEEKIHDNSQDISEIKGKLAKV